MDHNEILSKYHASAISFIEEGKRISSDALNKSKDGEWSAAFVIHHIADAEIQFGVRYANAHLMLIGLEFLLTHSAVK
jgi:hypothetical protein